MKVVGMPKSGSNYLPVTVELSVSSINEVSEHKVCGRKFEPLCSVVGLCPLQLFSSSNQREGEKERRKSFKCLKKETSCFELSVIAYL